MLRNNRKIPLQYTLPDFGVQKSLVLEKHQQIIMETSGSLFPSKTEKGKILTTLSEDIYRYKTYSTDSDMFPVNGNHW